MSERSDIKRLLQANYYERPDYVSLWNNWVAFLTRYIGRNHFILELGSGPKNKYTRLLSSMTDNLIGLDVDNVVLSNSYLKEAYVYNGDKFPFKECSYDIIVSHSVMEHVQQPEVVVREIYRVLKPDGFFLSRQPNVLNPLIFLSSLIPFYLKENITKRLIGSWDIGRELYPTHYNFNTPSTCKTLLAKNGFRIEEFSVIEGAPVYHGNSKLLFRGLMINERILNYTEKLSWLRSVIQFAACKEAYN